VNKTAASTTQFAKCIYFASCLFSETTAATSCARTNKNFI